MSNNSVDKIINELLSRKEYCALLDDGNFYDLYNLGSNVLFNWENADDVFTKISDILGIPIFIIDSSGTLEHCFVSKDIKTVTIPNNVVRMLIEYGVGIFSKNNNLEKVIMQEPLRSIGFSSFSYCEKLKTVVIPDSVKRIGDEAFSYCKSLENIEIPDSVTKVGGNLFLGCNIKSITLPKRFDSNDIYDMGLYPKKVNIIYK